jgi:hypothetical protein
MAISTIDTHKFVRRLEKAGMSLKEKGDGGIKF